MLRAPADSGYAIDAEVWTLPAEGFGTFVNAIPSPLCIGALQRANGTSPKGFLVEPEGLTGAKEISRFGGWRAYVAAHNASAPA